ncbi:NAD(P)H-dependent oxidoreductase [Companilactobacillus farciminis]|jgi:Acyl carrier protein phosphodiesterase|uniref:NAD(P)H-dependent oxidoreductase n=1 Tax=Companilactobacillus farciminis TaxID=1612 RepID=UPI00241D99F4|nr:NAD(P)H-dependent oxidoreductase [Companilactobacillus farciminis]
MPKVLVIYAHPLTEKGSSTHELYKHFINAYQKTNPNDEVVVHNVSEYMPYPLNKFAVSIYNKKLAKCDLNVDEKRFNDARQMWIDEFNHADKYVFVNPMYNLFIPAEMKSYIDMIMASHDTLHGSLNKLHGKKAIHLQASGNRYHKNAPTDDPQIKDLADEYLKMMLHVIGVDNYSSIFAEGMDVDPMNTIEILDNAFDEAEIAGQKF